MGPLYITILQAAEKKQMNSEQRESWIQFLVLRVFTSKYKYEMGKLNMWNTIIMAIMVKLSYPGTLTNSKQTNNYNYLCVWEDYHLYRGLNGLKSNNHMHFLQICN